jgi:hypothetical protein
VPPQQASSIFDLIRFTVQQAQPHTTELWHHYHCVTAGSAGGEGKSNRDVKKMFTGWQIAARGFDKSYNGHWGLELLTKTPCQPKNKLYSKLSDYRHYEF